MRSSTSPDRLTRERPTYSKTIGKASRFAIMSATEDEEGKQASTMSVFVLDSEGRPRHFYSCHPRMADDIQ